MYTNYWGLAEMPFENVPDPKFLYLTRQHEEALMRMLYCIRSRKGAGVLSGTFGCGKTVLSRMLIRELEQDVYRTAFVTNPRMDGLELLRMILHSLGIAKMPERKADVLAKMEDFLLNTARDGRETIIIIDEAHAVQDEEVFEEIRLLLNFQLESRFLLTLLLIGQPELTARVRANKQLAQRIAVWCSLESLCLEETGAYIRHRLAVAGAGKDIFSDGAVSLVHDRCGGIPRRINQLCDMSLFTAFGREAGEVDESIVREALGALEQ